MPATDCDSICARRLAARAPAAATPNAPCARLVVVVAAADAAAAGKPLETTPLAAAPAAVLADAEE